MIRSTSSKGLFRRPTDDVAALPANGVLAMRAFRATGESVEGNYSVRPRESESLVGEIGRIHSLFTFGFSDAPLLVDCMKQGPTGRKRRIFTIRRP